MAMLAQDIIKEVNPAYHLFPRSLDLTQLLVMQFQLLSLHTIGRLWSRNWRVAASVLANGTSSSVVITSTVQTPVRALYVSMPQTSASHTVH